MRKKTAASYLVISLLLAFQTASAGDRWLHVRVEDGGPDGEKVRVNLPLRVVESILPHIEADELSGGRLRLDAGELEGIDLRAVLEALRDTPDTKFVTVRSEGSSVQVAKEKDYLVAHAEQRDGDSTERIHARIPLAVVEALVGGNPDELDLLGALRVLGEFQGEELVSVESDDTSVRVWIDSSEDAD